MLDNYFQKLSLDMNYRYVRFDQRFGQHQLIAISQSNGFESL